MIPGFMEKATPPAAAPAPSQTGIHRLVLAASAAGALATLCWAGLQLRAARSEVRRLQEQITALPPVQNSAPTPGEDAAALARRLADSESQQKNAADKTAARVAELEGVIEFLRDENTAAQQTIERLGKLQAGPPAEPVKVKPGKPQTGRGNP